MVASGYRPGTGPIVLDICFVDSFISDSLSFHLHILPPSRLCPPSLSLLLAVLSLLFFGSLRLLGLVVPSWA